MTTSGRSKIKYMLISIKLFDHSWRSVKRGPEKKALEKEGGNKCNILEEIEVRKVKVQVVGERLGRRK